jgi:lysyl-tRNA synthetase class 2
MAWWHPNVFEAQKPYLERRMALIRALRGYFEAQNFWEVETPILQICPTIDPHIHAFQTQRYEPGRLNPQALYLHTSPEFAMKKLMVAGVPKLYQICHAFRNAERSNLHSPEFTLLEWYRAPGDYTELMADCEALLRHCAQALNIKEYRYNGQSADPFRPFLRISVQQAFAEKAGIDLAQYLEDTEAFSAAIASKGIRTAPDDRWDDLFFRVMAEKIEPNLGQGAPTILYDYPASMAALSRRKPEDPRFAERFELYVCGVELANAFGELTDPLEQRKRYEEDMALKQKLYGETYPLDEDFIRALEYGLPQSAGIALGIDRLAMLATNAQSIDQVLWAGKP